MLGRLLRTAFSARTAAAAEGPTAEQERLMARIHAVAGTPGRDGLDAFLQALDGTRPRCAAAHRYVGSHLGRLGLLERARAQLEIAVRIEPGHAGAWVDLGNVHRLDGRIDAAAECYDRALAVDPESEEAHLGRAACDAASGRTDAAVARLQDRVGANASPAAMQALVEALDRAGRCDDATQVCVEVLRREPDHGVARAALGFLLLKRELRPDAALEHFERALAIGYRDASLWSNRGIALQDLGRLDEALASYEEALALDPGHTLARFHRSLARLMQGSFPNAWADYDLRLASSDGRPPPCDLPTWTGEPSGEEILLYGEQGIGDEIMFASCVPDLLRICPRVTLACSPKLESLFRRSFPASRVLDLAQASRLAHEGRAPWQRMVAIGSLPRYFRQARAAFPRHRGYLRADPALVEMYRKRLARLGPGLKVGLSWRGGTDKTRRALRSVAPAELKPLFDLPGVRFVDLQYDAQPADDDLQPFVDAGVIVHWADALDDYDRTAALVASLDVVTSVCTAVIHLAGALGRPTFVMAPSSPEWRYGIAGPDMPWYPSVHVERQRAPREWGPVVAAVRERLAALRESAE